MANPDSHPARALESKNFPRFSSIISSANQTRPPTPKAIAFPFRPSSIRKTHVHSSAMKTLLLAIPFFLSTLTCISAGEEATQAAKAHLGFLFSADFERLGETYARDVLLMPGHEFLKPEYGMAEDVGRRLAVKVESRTLIAAMRKKFEGKPKPAPERVNARLSVLKFETLEAAEGEYVIEPADDVATPDGKLHFPMVKGDRLLKVSPPKGDFLLLQLRAIDGKWQVVSEYLD